MLSSSPIPSPAISLSLSLSPAQLQMDASQPLNTIVPLLLGLMRHPHEPARHASLSALNSLVPYESSQAGPLYRHLPAFLQGLGGLAADASARIRRSVCQALVLLVATQADALQPCFDEVCNFMLASVLDDEESVAIEACNFWLALLGERLAHAALAAKLPILVPHCVSRLRMTQAQVEREREEEEAMAQGSERIRWMRSKTQGGSDADSDSHFTVRKQCAFLLDQLSEAFPRAVLGIAGPCIQVMLQPQEAGPSWDREAGMLALGAIGYGCKAHLKVRRVDATVELPLHKYKLILHSLQFFTFYHHCVGLHIRHLAHSCRLSGGRAAGDEGNGLLESLTLLRMG